MPAIGLKVSRGERVFRLVNYTFLTILGAATLFPLWYVVVSSLSHPVLGASAVLWPKELYTANYWLVFTTEGIWRAYLVTIMRVGVTVPLSLLVTGAAGFCLTRREMVGRKAIIIYFFVTMFFNGGLIPTYMVMRTLGLLNTFWVMVIPFSFNVWMMIVMKTSFQGLPEGLVEAAIIDGADYFRTFIRIILPLSIPMMATLGLFQAVALWNDWFTGAFYVRDEALKPLQTFLQTRVLRGGLQDLLVSIRADDASVYGAALPDESLRRKLFALTPRSLESAYVIVSTVPILLVYPWIQKYFVKGVLIGSIKE